MTLTPSRHNIVGQIHGSDRWFIVNPLSRQADVLSGQEAAWLQAGTFPDPSAWVSKGYLVEPEAEQKRYRQAYLDHLADREADEIQLFFAPWYACNFACGYCYQASYDSHPMELDPAVIAAFFAHVGRTFSGRRKYLTLFGGAPLLPGDRARSGIAALLRGARDLGLDVAVVTNGFTLESYLPLLAEASIRELQVTLDGPQAIHDERRPLRGGGGTFEKIVAGIDAALAQDLPVNLRVVVDRKNLESLPVLASFAADRGWTAHPRFKTQLGRNYELHHCQAAPGQLYTLL